MPTITCAATQNGRAKRGFPAAAGTEGAGLDQGADVTANAAISRACTDATQAVGAPGYFSA
ncbi:hypothetical protein GCM10027202_19600 [Microvirgula curvata]